MTPLTMHGILSHNNVIRLICELVNITRKNIVIFVIFEPLNLGGNLKTQEMQRRLKDLYINSCISEQANVNET